MRVLLFCRNSFTVGVIDDTREKVPQPKNTSRAMKDYYHILGVSKTATTDEIRKTYRRMAMQYHPDRNPDDPQAEERFKEIAEAYGVLTDPIKRQQYDGCRADKSRPTTDFTYSQEDILRDLFKDPHFQHMFSGLLREFQKSGFRSSSTFIKKSFFGSKGGFFVGTIFFIGSLAGPLLSNAARKGLPGKPPLLQSVSKAVGSLIHSGIKTLAQGRKQNALGTRKHPELDTTYHTPLTDAELRHGKSVQILVYGEKGEETLQVKIPPGSRNGQKLRLRGKGRVGSLGRGDLYLHLVRKDR